MNCNSYLLGDVCKFIDYRGKTPPKTDVGIPLVTAKIIKHGVIQEPQEFIEESFYDEWMRRGIPKKGDVIFTTEAPLGEVAQIKTDEKLAFAQRVIILESDEKVLHSDYLFYALQDIVLKSRIEARSSGTTVFGIKAGELKKVEIDLPALETQKKIGAILSALDDKIALNQQISKNLKEQLDVIYRKMYPYLPSDQLPDGWNCVPLGTLCDSISIKHSFGKDKLIFLNTSDVENGRILHSTYSPICELPGQAKKTIKLGDILYSEIRPINRHFAFVTIPADDYVVSTKLMVIRSRKIDARRLYHYLTLSDVIDTLQLEAESRSGTFPQIRFENIQRIPIIIAPAQEELRFTRILHEHYRMIDYKNNEIEYLAAIRDALLPRLMSGEIDVSGIDIKP